jgi:hypothetical protein
MVAKGGKATLLGSSISSADHCRTSPRIRFLKDRDTNTTFSNRTTGFGKKKNFISKLTHEDRVYTDQKDKQEIMFNYFNDLLGTAINRSSTLDLNFFHREGMDLSALEAQILEDEVWETIKALPTGLDGYTGRFYKYCWTVIKVDFMEAILTLQQDDSRKLWLLNSAYLTLIRKKMKLCLQKIFVPSV